jgi:hypothetical protein
MGCEMPDSRYRMPDMGFEIGDEGYEMRTLNMVNGIININY